MKYILIAAISLLTITATAQKEIKLEDVANHVGDSVRVRGQVFGGKYLENAKGSPTFLNIGAAYPNAPLTVVIWKDVRTQFKSAPEELFNTLAVFVVGKVEMYKGKPQIVLVSPANIYHLVEAPTSDKVTSKDFHL